MENKFQKVESVPWREGLLAIISATLGVFAEPIVQAIAPPLFEPENLPYVTFCLISILFLVNIIYSLSFWRSTNQNVDHMAGLTNSLISSFGNDIKTVTYDVGYQELEQRIKDAQSELIILTQYAFDWQNDKAVWDKNRLNSTSRKVFYETLQTKLKNEQGKGRFRFVKIVRVPEPYKLESILTTDPIYAQNCHFILDIAKDEPEFASLRVSHMSFSNNVIIIDRKFAHISFELDNPNGNEVGASFVMLIDNPDSQAIQNLRKLVTRVETHSNLIIELNMPKSEIDSPFIG